MIIRLIPENVNQHAIGQLDGHSFSWSDHLDHCKSQLVVRMDHQRRLSVTVPSCCSTTPRLRRVITSVVVLLNFKALALRHVTSQQQQQQQQQQSAWYQQRVLHFPSTFSFRFSRI